MSMTSARMLIEVRRGLQGLRTRCPPAPSFYRPIM